MNRSAAAVGALIGLIITGGLAACTPHHVASLDEGPKSWLASVCPADATYTSDFDGLKNLAELGIREQWRCEWRGEDGDDESIDAYVVRVDPDAALTNTADAYQSGDGIAPDWLYRRLGDQWGVAFTYDSGRSLDPLEEIGFGH